MFILFFQKYTVTAVGSGDDGVVWMRASEGRNEEKLIVGTAVSNADYFWIKNATNDKLTPRYLYFKINGTYIIDCLRGFLLFLKKFRRLNHDLIWFIESAKFNFNRENIEVYVLTTIFSRLELTVLLSMPLLLTFSCYLAIINS